MSQDEIAVMDGGKCIMKLRGVRPFFSDKFDITKHSRCREQKEIRMALRMTKCRAFLNQ